MNVEQAIEASKKSGAEELYGLRGFFAPAAQKQGPRLLRYFTEVQGKASCLYLDERQFMPELEEAYLNEHDEDPEGYQFEDWLISSEGQYTLSELLDSWADFLTAHPEQQNDCQFIQMLK